MTKLKSIFFFIFIVAINCKAGDREVLITTAIADGKANNAEVFQREIDKLSANGGGKLIVPAGNFVTGPIFLKSKVELHLEQGACILGSTSRTDYPLTNAGALINADNQQNISITGNGVIDGRGAELIKDIYLLISEGKLIDEQSKKKRPSENNRPKLLFLFQCNNVKVSGVTLKNASSWVSDFMHCSDVDIDSITIESTCYWNNDGIDLVNSSNVRIKNCKINCSDDGICLKSEGMPKGNCENIWVENCTIRSSASAFKIGTGSYGGFRNINVKNLYVYDTYRSAIAIECVDGGTIENVNIQNVVAKNTGNAIFIRLGKRNETTNGITKLEHMHIANVTTEISAQKPDIGYPIEGPLQKYPHNTFPASITGVPGSIVRDVVLEDIEITSMAKADTKKACFSLDTMERVPEKVKAYPEFSMFGELPAWGLYVRHADSIQFKNIRFIQKGSDYRPCLVFDDVTNLFADSLNVEAAKENSLVILNNVGKYSFENVKLPVLKDKGILIK